MNKNKTWIVGSHDLLKPNATTTKCKCLLAISSAFPALCWLSKVLYGFVNTEKRCDRQIKQTKTKKELKYDSVSEATTQKIYSK